MRLLIYNPHDYVPVIVRELEEAPGYHSSPNARYKRSCTSRLRVGGILEMKLLGVTLLPFLYTLPVESFLN